MARVNLLGAGRDQNFISPDRNRRTRLELVGGNDSPNQGLQDTQKSHDSIEPIARTDEAISGNIAASLPELRIQIRPTSHQFRGDLTTGDCSPGEEVPLTSNPSKMAGQITGEMISDEQAIEGSGDALKALIRWARRIKEQQLGIFFQNHARPNDQKQGHNAINHQQNVMECPQADMRTPQGQKDQQGNSNSTNLEVLDVENSSHFSFGVKPMDTMPSSVQHPKIGNNSKYTNEIGQVYVQEQHQSITIPPNTNPSGNGSQTGTSSHSSSSKNVVNLCSGDAHVNVNGQKKFLREEHEKGRGATGIQQQDLRGNTYCSYIGYAAKAYLASFKKEFITPLLESVGKVLYLDTASIKRTKASMAKVKVQVDFTKSRPRHVWISLDDKDLTIGRWQPIEYESIPPYCVYCKHQGHMIEDCNFKTLMRTSREEKS
ncbi:hypothetical protein H5410_030363 [Solanum commersonii]|uniref:DUF4283 domain-containing protein n=1 Tax=Solanum commersonii TaxID=4109 RepID=A0A9J5YFF8_SOLCO|nr:hypothetical protein H5410_030363 [Solanum commersonii]